MAGKVFENRACQLPIAGVHRVYVLSFVTFISIVYLYNTSMPWSVLPLCHLPAPIICFVFVIQSPGFLFDAKKFTAPTAVTIISEY